MKRLFLFLCLLPFLLLQANDALFSHDDPTSFHHVSVISGNLHLSFQDVALLGPVPFALSRSYSSSGALEKNKDKIDISLQSYREGWMPLGGWDLLAYTHLLIEPGRSNKGFKAYLSEKKWRHAGLWLPQQKRRLQDLVRSEADTEDPQMLRATQRADEPS